VTRLVAAYQDALRVGLRDPFGDHRIDVPVSFPVRPRGTRVSGSARRDPDPRAGGAPSACAALRLQCANGGVVLHRRMP
jgi:hypothetical protein